MQTMKDILIIGKESESVAFMLTFMINDLRNLEKIKRDETLKKYIDSGFLAQSYVNIVTELSNNNINFNFVYENN
jgi:hypothetical protein